MPYTVVCRYIGDDPDMRDESRRYPEGRVLPGIYQDKGRADAEAVRQNSKPYTPYFFFVKEHPTVTCNT